MSGCLKFSLPFFKDSSSINSSNSIFWAWKKPYFLSLTWSVGFIGRLAFGYFINAPKVAALNLSPPGIPWKDSVKILKPLALPSKSQRSWYSNFESLFLNSLPLPLLKKWPIDFSPLCPKGGFPISWAKEAAAVIAPKSLGW